MSRESKERRFSREFKLAALARMAAGENVSALCRELGIMRKDLDHLPAKKQRELARVVEILFAEFEEAVALATSARKKSGRILKIILFGSYARGGWVDEPHTAKGYLSLGL